jgi:SAM-dependent methyltransferase
MQSFHRRIFFERRYFGRPRWDTQVSPPELIEFIAQHAPGRALDVGCGTGTNLATLIQAGWQGDGVDLSRLAICKARRRLQRMGLSAGLRSGDFTRLEIPPRAYTLILDIGCYHSLPEMERAGYREKIVRGLSRGGTFLLYVHLKRPGAAAGHGFTEADQELFSGLLRLSQRQDGSESGSWPSAWLTFIKETD